MRVPERSIISPELRINEVIRLYPATVRVFAELGMDSCCGGGLSLAEAAQRHRVHLPVLLEALEVAGGGASAP